MSKIEAVIISVNYSDFLELTLKENEKHFDHIVVITDTNDKSTPKVCKPYKDKITCLATNAFYANGAKFNKGLCINFGFQVLKYKKWVFNLDSDIILKKDFRERFLNIAELPYGYGSRRYDLKNINDYISIKNKNKKDSDFLLFRGFSYGFLFGFHYKSETFQSLYEKYRGYPYPYWFPNAAESDWVFSTKWGEMIYDPPLGKFPDCHYEKHNDRSNRLLKEIPSYVYHIGEVGKNHNGIWK